MISWSAFYTANPNIDKRVELCLSWGKNIHVQNTDTWQDTYIEKGPSFGDEN